MSANCFTEAQTMENSLDSLISTARAKREEIVQTLAERYDFPSLKLVGQAAGIHIAYFVGEKMNTFEMAEALVHVADRKGRLGELLSQLTSPKRNAAKELSAILGLPTVSVAPPHTPTSSTKTVFLSHATVDKPFVLQLKDRLAKDGYHSWVDKFEIKVGQSIRRVIEQGVDSSGYFAIVLSPEAVASEWVKMELDMAYLKELQAKSVLLLPILYRDCKIPSSLAFKKYADFRVSQDAGYQELLDALR